jgi:hypothetical protein
MRRRRLMVLPAVLALGAALVLAATPAPAATELSPRLVTKTRPYVRGLQPGVKVKAIVTAGDVWGKGRHKWQMSGIPDGIGVNKTGHGRLQVYVNHEWSRGEDPDNARIDHLTLNKSAGLIHADYVLDGSEGFIQLCSSTLTKIGGTPYYTTGEEDASGVHHGVALAVNTNTNHLTQLPWMGHMLHENVVPMKGMSQSVTMLMEDGRPRQSQLWAYTAANFQAALHGRGQMRVFVAKKSHGVAVADSASVARASTASGRFVAVPSNANTSKQDLDKMARKVGAMHFYRVEDGTADPWHKGRFYFSETGAANTPTLFGRVWKLEIDPHNVTRAKVTPILDGGHGDDMVQPDNLGISKKALIIQEDRNYHRSGANRILTYTFASKTLTTSAKVVVGKHIKKRYGPGRWESSGVVNVSSFFGPGTWLLDVQGDKQSVLQQGPSLKVDSARGEGGQLLLVTIPGT